MVGPIQFEDALTTVNQYADSGDLETAAEFLRSLHPADSAEVLGELDPEIQFELLKKLEAPELAEVFGQMYQEDMAEVAQHLDKETLADVLDEMEPDVAADLLGEMEPAEAALLLDEMDESAPVESLMQYDEDTAGGIMNLPPPSIRRYMTVAEAIAFLRQHYHSAEDMYYLYVLDRNEKLIGVVNLRVLILSEPEQTIEAIMNHEVVSISVDEDQEEAVKLLSRYDLLSLPVVDKNNRLVGIITVDDLVDVLEEEATEDIYRLAQVSEDSDIFSPIPQAIRSRLPWLVINLGTAILASSVYSIFEGTIEKAAFLAALTPIVAGQGGNAGTQTLTVIVRSLALGEIELRDTLPALWHEIRVGVVNGLSIGALVGLIAWFWKGNPMVGVVIGIAMVGNLVIAAIAGVLVPMLLKTARVDPALASSVFVTTFTDCCGFFLFLGLATYFIHWIV